MFRILLRPGWTLVQGPLVCRFRLAGNDRHRSPRDRRSWNCFRAYILDWHDHSRDSCEAPRIDHAPKDQLNLFHPTAQRNAFRRRDAHQQSILFALRNQSLRRSPNSIRLCWGCRRLFLSICRDVRIWLTSRKCPDKKTALTVVWVRRTGIVSCERLTAG